jgi:predicted FMN-binding regulatory protein PaiB
MFDSRKYRPQDPALVEDFIRSQRHATLMAAAPGEAPQASILPFVLLDDDTVELHCVQADATFRAAAANPQVSLLISDFLAFTPHEWIDPVDGSEATLQFQAVLLQGRATLSTDPAEVAGALARLMEAYGHGPQYRPVTDDELYGPQLRRLGTIRLAIETRQAKFKAGTGDAEQRIQIAEHLRARGGPNDGRAADVIEALAPRLTGLSDTD